MIARHIHGRTDNYIKNKFYSTIRKKLRKINKMLGIKNSTSTVKQIKPKILSNIIDAASSNSQIGAAWGELSQLLFYCDDKKLAKLMKGGERTKIEEIINKINIMNQTYLQKKESEKSEKILEKNREILEQIKKPQIHVRRILLRKRGTSASQTKIQRQVSKSQLKIQSQYQEQTFENILNLGQNQFNSLQQTPIGKSFSYSSAKSSQQHSNEFDICKKSPGGWNFPNSPCNPTPGVCTLQFKNGIDVKDLRNPFTYQNFVLNLINIIDKTLAEKKGG